MSILKWLDDHFEEFFLTIFLIVLTCLVTANVVLRYILGSGITWSEAICRYCLVYSTFFSIAHWVRRSSGIAVDALVQILPSAVQNILHWIVRVIIIVFFAILFKSSIGVLKSVGASGTTDGTLGFSMTYIYFACCIGFLDALVRSIQVFIIDLMNLKKKEA